MKRILLFILALSALIGCSKEDDPISRRYPCRFYFYHELHPTSVIMSAYHSAGMYVYVYTQVDQTGVRYVYAKSNRKDDTVESNAITTAIEKGVPYTLGANNKIGLIIGRTNFNGPTAFDRTCPNCTTNQELTWNENNRQQVECKNCGRIYDLETGSITSGADGSTLLRYAVTIDDRRLIVGN